MLVPESDAPAANDAGARPAGRACPAPRPPAADVQRPVRHRPGRSRARSGFDVLLAHNSTTAAGLLRAGLRTPLATFFHASAVLELEFLHRHMRFGPERAAAYALQPVLARLERQSLDGAPRVLLLSEFTRGLLAARNPAAAARATLVPGAVDTSRFAPGDRSAVRERLGIGPDETLLFTARRLVPRMGLEELIDAAALLGDIPRLRLAIAGAGPLRTAWSGVESRRARRVELLGRLSDDELVDWYAPPTCSCCRPSPTRASARDDRSPRGRHARRRHAGRARRRSCSGRSTRRLVAAGTSPPPTRRRDPRGPRPAHAGAPRALP